MTRMTRKQPDSGLQPDEPPGGDLVHGDLTKEIIGAFYEVYNTLGYGFLESVYTRAMVVELRLRGLRVECEVPIKVSYKIAASDAFAPACWSKDA